MRVSAQAKRFIMYFKRSAKLCQAPSLALLIAAVLPFSYFPLVVLIQFHEELLLRS